MRAFTMAEVLITLGIIGIVAAMTMPTVIKNYQRKEAETRLKKAYSTISQAFLAAQAKHGEVKDWENWEDAEFVLEHYIKPEIKGAKVFPTNESRSNLMCFEGKFPSHYQNGDKESTQYGWLDNVYISSPFFAGYTASIKLTDGTCVGLNPVMTSSSNWQNSFSRLIFIDINGSNDRPNKAGYDLFLFVVDGNRIMPWGYEKSLTEISDGSDRSCKLQAYLGGFYCAARIMAEGWTITYW